MFRIKPGAANVEWIRAARSTQTFDGFFVIARCERMRINGVDIIFIIPPLLLILIAIVMGAWRFLTRGTKAALVSVVRVLVYGGFTLLVLFIAWIGIYYSTGGH